ncbi:Zn-dependent hydrolase [Pseudorhizobium endolithicum]|uniref:Zn-dependent hydrolase n=2 Tax=Pseudorhizobium endolithicum TaxID=1191678 RepID=A0ABN7JPM6_9HYPH|nr:MBL fold metallo-hydrolase [Pseudorhizobium endolithicum]CAD7041328.1 Zn-dependent hydrolase [Pseudorhizobium endolithicum]
MLRTFAFVLFGIIVSGSAAAQEAAMAVSQCQAIAYSLPGGQFASLSATEGLPVIRAQAEPQSDLADKETVEITYVGHSTYFIETPAGVGIATDYSGVYRPVRVPDVVTMNKAHSTHFTLAPDAGIEEVLPGWSDVPGEKAQHNVVVGDAYIRNVTTDIRSWDGAFEENGNSIFIFEIAGLCIGHLGHLHHELTDSHYAEIGRLDILMVPVDGGLTMGADSMSRVADRLRSSLILPMHRPSALDRFLGMLAGKFDIRYASEPIIRVSMRTLPKRPTILVPQGM